MSSNKKDTPKRVTDEEVHRLVSLLGEGSRAGIDDLTDAHGAGYRQAYDEVLSALLTIHRSKKKAAKVLMLIRKHVAKNALYYPKSI